MKCQNILVNVLVHLLEQLSFGLRCLSFWLLKFASQLKLIQSVVRVGILGICVTGPALGNLGLRVTSSEFQGPSSRVPCPRVPESGVSGSRVLGLRVPGSRVSGSRMSGSWVSGLRSRVSGPNFRLCLDDSYTSQTFQRKKYSLERKLGTLRKEQKIRLTRSCKLIFKFN